MVTQQVLSQEKIAEHAVKFSERWKNEKSEKSEAQTFINEFFKIFGLDRKSVASLEKHPDGSRAFIDGFWVGKFMIEMKSLGENLDEAMNEQALRYYVQLKKEQEPRYILVCDFQRWYLKDKNDNSDYFFKLSELVDHIGLFGFMTDRPKIIQADPVNMKSAEILGTIFDKLKKSGYSSGQTEYLLTRLTFCLFADDTGIFGDSGKFQQYLKERIDKDGSNLGRYLANLFAVLNQHPDNRSKTLDSHTRSFPYINGALFEKDIDFPSFDAEMRQLLLDAAAHDWSKVSPAIFGNMFQTVMDQDARREMGAHYTSEENILKVLRPLFLDKLNKEFDEINQILDDSQKDRFIEFQNKLANLKFFDPACGSGNFLVVAYREIRRLEHNVIMKIYGYDGERIDTDKLSKVDVDQFYGIEIIDFSSKIAETSLWMMDHIMNRELSDRYGFRFRRIPIKKKPTILCKNALKFDWNKLLSSSECDYIFGNPPFSGARQMTEEQKEQTKEITKSTNLDYVSNWFVKASQYIDKKTGIAFVSTNSITQGEQVALLWPQILKDGLEISFAYKSFKWKSESKNSAIVSVIIIGLSYTETRKRLFDHDGDYIIETNPKKITNYLRETDNESSIIVEQTPKPINKLPKATFGCIILDYGQYTFKKSEYLEFIKLEPQAKKWFLDYYSGGDFINNKKRYVLSLQNIKSDELKKLPNVMKRVKNVKTSRFNSKRKETKACADTPLKFCEIRIPSKRFLAIPRVSTENRRYVPMGFMEPSVVTSDLIYHIEEADHALFGLLTSKMHVLWFRNVGGKLGTAPRYSAKLAYNTFPVPENYSTLDSYAKQILEIRKKYTDFTLADLYDPLTMPPDLLKAHQVLDKAVEKLYRQEPFKSDNERFVFLLEEYQKMATTNQTTLD